MPVTHVADPAPAPNPPDDPASAVGPGRLVDHPPAPAYARLSDRVLGLADRYRRWVFAGVLVLYAAGFNARWRPEPDSALYLAIGRNVAEGLGYTYHGKHHLLVYPGVPAMFAGVFQAFGPGSVVPHLVLMWLLGLAALGLAYRLFLLHSGRPAAVLLTFGVAISGTFYRYAFELLSDLPFLVGVLAFLVGYEAVFYRRARAADAGGGSSVSHDGAVVGTAGRPTTGPAGYDWVLLVGGLAAAVATRPNMLALIPAAGLALLWSVIGGGGGRRRGRTAAAHLAVAALVVLAVALFYLKDPRHRPRDPTAPVSTNYVEEDQLFHLGGAKLADMARTAFKNLPATLEVGLARASFGTPVLPGLNTVLAIAVMAAGVWLVRVRPLWGMWVLATVLMVTQVPKPLPRYFLGTVPVLVFGWWALTREAEGWALRATGSRRAAGAVFLLLFGLGGAANVASTAAFVYEQRQVPFLGSYKEGRYASVYEAARLVEQHTPPSGAVADLSTTWVAVPAKFGRVLSFLSRRYCVEPEKFSPLDPRRHAMFVLDPTEPPEKDGSSARAARDAEPRRVPIPRWLRERGAAADPDP
ncbi:MAG: hypothetical protein JWO31_1255, partial [Phycisphaerales bacterium]|nr:hypothetical protein [Phycisphaerales bacterium]